ncbi:MAG: hypothetical protein D6753_16215 [Planctomycetota bacterium]|nr:MAG: hypothetical protein D6753_16215 [Planctomycetota bacterium]
MNNAPQQPEVPGHLAMDAPHRLAATGRCGFRSTPASFQTPSAVGKSNFNRNPFKRIRSSWGSASF